jgi:hypothetical protein
MNAPENKRMLWDLTNHLYRGWMSRDQVITLFEQTITEFDHGTEPLMEKNKRFLSAYVDRVAAIQPNDAAQRAAMFEERLLKRHQQGGSSKKTVSFEPEIIEIVAVPVPEKNITLEFCMNEVALLREEVRLLKEKVQLLSM